MSKMHIQIIFNRQLDAFVSIRIHHCMTNDQRVNEGNIHVLSVELPRRISLLLLHVPLSLCYVALICTLMAPYIHWLLLFSTPESSMSCINYDKAETYSRPASVLYSSPMATLISAVPGCIPAGIFPSGCDHGRLVLSALFFSVRMDAPA